MHDGIIIQDYIDTDLIYDILKKMELLISKELNQFIKLSFTTHDSETLDLGLDSIPLETILKCKTNSDSAEVLETKNISDSVEVLETKGISDFNFVKRPDSVEVLETKGISDFNFVKRPDSVEVLKKVNNLTETKMNLYQGTENFILALQVLIEKFIIKDVLNNLYFKDDFI